MTLAISQTVPVVAAVASVLHECASWIGPGPGAIDAIRGMGGAC